MIRRYVVGAIVAGGVIPPSIEIHTRRWTMAGAERTARRHARKGRSAWCVPLAEATFPTLGWTAFHVDNFDDLTAHLVDLHREAMTMAMRSNTPD